MFGSVKIEENPKIEENNKIPNIFNIDQSKKVT